MSPVVSYLGALLAVVLLTSCSAVPEADLVITGATLIDGSGAEPREGTTIVVRDGRVTMVVPDGSITPSANATVIDASGQHVIPGLADMHVHFSLGAPLPRRPDETEMVLGRALYYGVTTILQVGGSEARAESIRFPPASTGRTWPRQGSRWSPLLSSSLSPGTSTTRFCVSRCLTGK